MSEANENMEIEDLFRSKLENSELIPGADSGKALMRRLWRRELLRFTPSRLNIYYIGGVIAAGIAAILLLTSTPRTVKHETIQSSPGKIVSPIAVKTNDSTVKKEAVSSLNVSTSENKSSEVQSQQTGLERKNVSGTAEQKFPAGIVSGKTDTLVKSSQIKERVTTSNVSGMTLQRKISSSFSASITSGCLPLKVRFRNTSVAYDSCYWTFGDGGFSSAENPDWIFDNQGEYRVTLKVFNRDGTQSVSSEAINIYPHPVARFEINPDNPIIPDDEVHFLNTSVDAMKCKWEFGDGTLSDLWEPVHKYNRYDNFNIKLVIWSEQGCSDSATIINAFAGSGSYIKFPNAFIPNPEGPTGGNYSQKSDEAAQIFHPVTSGVAQYQLRIFSKIGMLIFESNDINTGWDGYHKGELCDPGVYVWKVRGTYKNGEPFVKMGDVTLLKNQ